MRFATALVCSCALIGALSGCKKKPRNIETFTSEATANSGTQSTSNVPGVTDDTIKLGMVASFQSAQAGLATELYRGAQAYWMELNATGGIHGRKVELSLYNDSYTAEGGRDGANKAIEEGAFVLFASSGVEPSNGILRALEVKGDKSLFLWGAMSGSVATRTAPLDQYIFNIRGSYQQYADEILSGFAKAGIKKVALLVQDDGFGKATSEAAKNAIERNKQTLVAEASMSKSARPGQAKAADEVAKFRAAGAQAVILATTYNPSSVFTLEARDQGWDVPVATLGSADTLLRVLVAQEKKTLKPTSHRVMTAFPAPPPNALEIRVVREYRELLDKRNPQVPAELADPNYRPLRYSATGCEGYIMAKTMGEALARAGRNLTREGLRSAAHSIRDWDVGAGTPITFGPNDNQGFERVWLVGIKDEEFSLVPDLRAYLNEKPKPIKASEPLAKQPPTP